VHVSCNAIIFLCFTIPYYNATFQAHMLCWCIGPTQGDKEIWEKMLKKKNYKFWNKILERYKENMHTSYGFCYIK